MYDYAADAGAGFEHTTANDFKLPWLRILDAKSKQIESVEGAKAGKIINTVTNQLFDSIVFVPSITEAYYVEWIPRAQGGGDGNGFVGVHAPDAKIVVDALKALGPSKFVKGADGKVIKPTTADGHELVETYYVHGVLVSEDGLLTPAVIAFASTNIGVYQSWLTTAKMETVVGAGGKRMAKPLFAHAYKLGSTKITKGGNTWYVFTTAFAKGDAAKSLIDPKGDLYLTARKVRDSVVAGTAEVDHSGAQASGGGAADAEIPF